MGEFVFHVPLRGNVWLLFGMAAVFLAGALSMGMLISIVAKSQLLASQIAMMVTFLPAFLLSGFQVPIANMPRPIQWSRTWCRPAISWPCCTGIYLRAWGWSHGRARLALLACFGLAMVAAGRM